MYRTARSNGCIANFVATAKPLKDEVIVNGVSLLRASPISHGRHAFIFGHGAWNSRGATATKLSVQQWEDAFPGALPAYFAPGMLGSSALPRMLMLAHA